MKFYKSLYIHTKLYVGLLIFIVLWVLAFIFPPLYLGVWLLFGLYVAVIIADFSLLFGSQRQIKARRYLPEKLSNGDFNSIRIEVTNPYSFKCRIDIIDELPLQFQMREHQIQMQLDPRQEQTAVYHIQPKSRGVYQFGVLNIYLRTPIGLLMRRCQAAHPQDLPSYPSFLQMKQYDLIAFSRNPFQLGFRKIRKIGHTSEFEQIKEYVSGDDIRTINWKATAKKNQVMVNQYQEENSQNIYLIIDRGRVMKMPFDGLSLLDYAINSSLALSNVILKKKDKVGLLSFSKKIDNRLAAESKSFQLHKMMEQLYRVETDFFETDYSRLYSEVKKTIRQRSLLILFTNFETLDGLNRQLSYLRALAQNHLLLVVFFENTEITKLSAKTAAQVSDIYDKTIAEKFNFEKRLIVSELKKYGIHSVLTQPENLSLDTINTYLEIKARGLI